MYELLYLYRTSDVTSKQGLDGHVKQFNPYFTKEK